MEASRALRLTPESIPASEVEIMTQEETDQLRSNEEQIKIKRDEVAEETRKKFRVFDGWENLSKIEDNSKTPEKLLGLDIRDAINDIITAMKGGQNLDEIIRNVTVRPDFDWSDTNELRKKFEFDAEYSFGDKKNTRLAREIFEKLLKAGKIVHKSEQDERTPGNSQARWIGEGTPWEK